jgi:hypothetical protein
MRHDDDVAGSAADGAADVSHSQSTQELEVLVTVGSKLSTLPADGARRILKYFIDKYRLENKDRSHIDGLGSTWAPDQVVHRERFRDFAEMFDVANPGDGLDRALVAAYWHQVVQGQDDFESQLINTELRNLGHPSTNITRDFDKLMARSPRPVMQVRKAGLSQQARKRYKLTREGIRAVEAMISEAASHG